MYKLWVIGESANPDDWSEWSYYKFVIAKDIDEALEVSGTKYYKGLEIAEVLMDKARYLITNSGNDRLET